MALPSLSKSTLITLISRSACAKFRVEVEAPYLYDQKTVLFSVVPPRRLAQRLVTLAVFPTAPMILCQSTAGSCSSPAK